LLIVPYLYETQQFKKRGKDDRRAARKITAAVVA